MGYVPPLRKRPRRGAPTLTRGLYLGPHVHLPGSKVPKGLSRRQADALRRSGAIKED